MSDLNAKPEAELAASDPQVAAGELSAEDDDAMADWASALAEQNGNAEVNPAAAGVFRRCQRSSRPRRTTTST